MLQEPSVQGARRSMKLDAIRVGRGARRDDRDLDALAGSIAARGFRQPR
jgi:hypothetical protein